MPRRRLCALAFAGAFVLGASALAPADAEAGVNAREQRQRERIRTGVEDGSLTRPEVRRLARNQRHIELREWRIRADDGLLGPHERARLDRALDRSSARIYRQRHDGQSR
jgi:hypothetical protein